MIDACFEFNCLVGQKYILDCDFTDHHPSVSLLLHLVLFSEKRKKEISEQSLLYPLREREREREINLSMIRGLVGLRKRSEDLDLERFI